MKSLTLDDFINHSEKGSKSGPPIEVREPEGPTGTMRGVRISRGQPESEVVTPIPPPMPEIKISDASKEVKIVNHTSQPLKTSKNAKSSDNYLYKLPSEIRKSPKSRESFVRQVREQFDSDSEKDRMIRWACDDWLKSGNSYKLYQIYQWSQSKGNSFKKDKDETREKFYCSFCGLPFVSIEKRDHHMTECPERGDKK
jgi:hypothetical protein